MPRSRRYRNSASPILVSSSILKLRTPATLRGTFHSICRATTVVLAAASLIGTVTSQADLPYPTTSTSLPRASSASWKSVPAQSRPPAAVNSASPGKARDVRLAEHAVGDDEPVERLRSSRRQVQLPAPLGGPGGAHVRLESAGPARTARRRRRARPAPGPRRPLGVVGGHREVRERVLGLGALRGEAGVAAGRAPHAADVGGAVEHLDGMTGLGEHLGGGEPGDARADDGDAHRSARLGREPQLEAEVRHDLLDGRDVRRPGRQLGEGLVVALQARRATRRRSPAPPRRWSCGRCARRRAAGRGSRRGRS